MIDKCPCYEAAAVGGNVDNQAPLGGVTDDSSCSENIDHIVTEAKPILMVKKKLEKHW